MTVIDEWTRECLAIHVAGGIRSKAVIEVLAKLVSVRGAPSHLRSDNGSEFVSEALLQWVLDEVSILRSLTPASRGRTESTRLQW
jgi:putative transposase